MAPIAFFWWLDSRTILVVENDGCRAFTVKMSEVPLLRYDAGDRLSVNVVSFPGETSLKVLTAPGAQGRVHWLQGGGYFESYPQIIWVTMNERCRLLTITVARLDPLLSYDTRHHSSWPRYRVPVVRELELRRLAVSSTPQEG